MIQVTPLSPNVVGVNKLWPWQYATLFATKFLTIFTCKVQVLARLQSTIIQTQRAFTLNGVTALSQWVLTACSVSQWG